MRKTKVKHLEGEWTYILSTPDCYHYVGISSGETLTRRWSPNKYGGIMDRAIKYYGWENIKKTVVAEGLTHDEAVELEGELIALFKRLGVSLNSYNSGKYVHHSSPRVLLTPEERKTRALEYERRRRQKPERKAYLTEYQKKAECKIYNAVAGWNRNHPDRVVETPLEAKQKYIATGYIPSYITIRINNNN